MQHVQVRLGKIFTNRAEPSKEQLISADRILIHPHYDHHSSDYDRDIALIRLKTSVIYTDYVRPICLPLRGSDKDKFLLRPGMTGVITGKKIITILVAEYSTIECFHMTSRRPYWCPKTMKRRPCWCPKRILWELNSFLMQTLSFVPINLHRCWPRE